ncbi:MAG: hypothetical protein RIS64_3397, partial [Bacteroidota bacterium]
TPWIYKKYADEVFTAGLIQQAMLTDDGRTRKDPSKQYGTGGKMQGKKYMLFLVEVLKPYIDKTFRTKSERIFTGIGGSSLGGLISLYAGLKYSTIFGRLLIFSPSLWVVSGAKMEITPFNDTAPTRIYMYAGGQEGANMVPNARRVKRQLESHEFSNKKVEINLSIDPKGQHTEARWGQEFTKAIEWLF